MAIIKHTHQRVGVFIDAQNLYHSARNLYGKRVDFGAILTDAIADRQLIRALAYVITSEAGDESNFFEALTKLGIETKTKDLQIFVDGSKKADWDVGIAVDAITLAPKLDTVILLTGDGDFVPLVEYLQKHSGIQVEVVAFGKSSSARLIAATDDFMDLSDDPKRYLMKGRDTRRNQRKSTSPRRSSPDKTTEKEAQSRKNASKQAQQVAEQKGPKKQTKQRKQAGQTKQASEKKQIITQKQPKQPKQPRQSRQPKENKKASRAK